MKAPRHLAGGCVAGLRTFPKYLYCKWRPSSQSANPGLSWRAQHCILAGVKEATSLLSRILPREDADVLRLDITTLPQPNETTCGPTCLHAVYGYWGKVEPLETVIKRMRWLNEGGTYAVFLGCDALRNGFSARIYTYNVTVFDPSWFTEPDVDLRERLTLQRMAKTDRRVQNATEGYLDFLNLGGRIRLVNLSQHLLYGLLRRRIPLLTGLSSTFLYRSKREFGNDDQPDDIRGSPVGHFVVLAGWDERKRKVLVVDPYQPHRYGPALQYWLSVDRVIAAILLGIVTHDANLLVIYPRHDP